MGHVAEHPQITEYDVNGQFYGWGAQPAAMLKDIKRRLTYGTEHKVTGYIARTDWEGVQDWSCFDNPNMLNLYAIAAYATEPNISEKDIYLKWLTGEKMLKKDISPQELRLCIDEIAELMGKTWPVVEKTNFVNGCLFSNDSCLHLTPDQFTFIGGTHHSLSEWDPEKKDALAMTKENIAVIIGDKQQALEEMTELYNHVLQGITGLSEDAYANLREHFDFMYFYVRGFRLTARGYCFGRYFTEVGKDDVLAEGKTARTLLSETIQEMESYKEELINQTFLSKYPYDAQLNPERVEFYTNALRNMLAK